MESFVILVVIVVAGLGVSAAAQAGKRKPIKDAWRAAASALNLDMTAGDLFTYPEIHGEIRGHAVKVSTVTRGAESKRRTRYRIILRSPLGLDLRIGERTSRSDVQRLFRRPELSFDDPELDERLVVRTRAPDTVLGMLGPLRRRALRDFYAAFPGAAIDDTTITWEIDGVDDRRERMVRNVRGLVTMADDLDRWLREPEPRPLRAGDETAAAVARSAIEPKRLPESIRATSIGASGTAASPPLHKLLDPGWIPPRQPESDDTDMSEEPRVPADPVIREPQPAIEARRRPRLRIASDRAVLETAPPDDVPPTPEQVEAPPQVPAPPTPLTSGPTAQDGSLHAGDVSRTLFGTRLMGEEMQRRFAEAYQGRRVLWPGTLRSTSTYPFDHVFGSERGARATFEIVELADVYGARCVRAVVQVPEATAKSLIPRVGQRLLFEGTLCRCEPFMRTLYLLDGAVPEVDTAADR